MPGLGVSSPPELSRHYWHLGIKNAIRPTALGKKNWLFIGAAEAGERSAIISKAAAGAAWILTLT
jgi:hypothetical protein